VTTQLQLTNISYHNKDKFNVTCVSYRFANLLASHLSVAPPDGWGIKLVLVNDFKIFAETLQGWFFLRRTSSCDELTQR
jgi:hypothetical protein